MPSLVIPSPIILDHSFPRNDNELRIASAALGQLEEEAANNRISIVLTQTLQSFIESFDWQRQDATGVIREIHRLLIQWFLQPNESLILLRELVPETPYEKHPVPIPYCALGLLDFWADEVGKLLAIHDTICDEKNFFIGVACANAFAGLPKSEYEPPPRRSFPLVGHEDTSVLHDAYRWDTPADLHRWNVSYSDAKQNCFSVGAISVEKPNGGSHYKVSFSKARSWTLDPNTDPLPDRFMKELISITGYPFNAIKFALATGALPLKSFRLGPYVA